MAFYIGLITIVTFIFIEDTLGHINLSVSLKTDGALAKGNILPNVLWQGGSYGPSLGFTAKEPILSISKQSEFVFYQNVNSDPSPTASA